MESPSSEQFGYEDNLFVAEPSEYLRCTVCTLVAQNPYGVLHCGHKFCSLCYLRLKTLSEEANAVLRCPVDREVIDVTEVFEDIALRRIIEGLEVRCVGVEKGCKWTGELSSLPSHCEKCQHACEVGTAGTSVDSRREDMGVVAGLCERVEMCENSLLEKDKEISHLKIRLTEMETKYESTLKEIEVMKKTVELVTQKDLQENNCTSEVHSNDLQEKVERHVMDEVMHGIEHNEQQQPQQQQQQQQPKEQQNYNHNRNRNNHNKVIAMELVIAVMFLFTAVMVGLAKTIEKNADLLKATFDINECTGFANSGWPSHNCSPYANCTNTIGSFSCECKLGYVGDGVTCIVHPCDIQNGGCSHTCAKKGVESVCACPKGLILGADLKTCKKVLQHHRGKSSDVIIGDDNVVEFKGIATVAAPSVRISYPRKVWFEVTFLEGTLGKTISQIGWGTKDFLKYDGYITKGVGDDSESWAYDGQRQCTWHDEQKGWSPQKSRTWGKRFDPDSGYVLGVAADMENGKLLFGLDGHWNRPMGEAFQIDIWWFESLFPAITGENLKISVNFGEREMKFGPPDASYEKLIDVIDSLS